MERLALLVLILSLGTASAQAQENVTFSSFLDATVANSASYAMPCDQGICNPGVCDSPRTFHNAIHGCDTPRLGFLANFRQQHRIYAGYEFGWLQPRFTDNVAYVARRTMGDKIYAFDHPFELTPRIWIGIENSCCTGLRVSYWNLDTNGEKQVAFAVAGSTPLSLTIEGADGHLSRTATANLGDAFTLRHSLELRTIDFEGTQRTRIGRNNVLGAFGLRYVKMHQRTKGVATDGTGSLTELVCQDLNFDGFGPTAAIAMTRCLFPGHRLLSRLSFWANGRGSILFGQQEQEIALVTGGGAGLANDRYVHDHFVPIGELAGGLQTSVRPFGRGLWTIRTGYRAESWFGAGGPIDTDSNIGLHGVVLSLIANW